MREILEASRVCLCLFFLLLSSWHDYKKREVPDSIWLIYAPSGFFVLLLQYFVTGTPIPTFEILLSLGVVGISSLILFYLGMFGGADAKCMLCLSLAFPLRPSSFKPLLNVDTPLFALSVLVNAILFSSFSVLAIGIYNLYRLIIGENLFDEFKNEGLTKKIVVFFTGIKVDASKLTKSLSYIPLETISREEGRIVRKLQVAFRLSEEPDLTNVPPNGKIWATPGLPFLIFITLSFITSLLLGDILIWSIIKLTKVA